MAAAMVASPQQRLEGGAMPAPSRHRPRRLLPLRPTDPPWETVAAAQAAKL